MGKVWVTGVWVPYVWVDSDVDTGHETEIGSGKDEALYYYYRPISKQQPVIDSDAAAWCEFEDRQRRLNQILERVAEETINKQENST
jgi:hypothetical protein